MNDSSFAEPVEITAAYRCPNCLMPSTLQPKHGDFTCSHCERSFPGDHVQSWNIGFLQGRQFERANGVP